MMGNSCEIVTPPELLSVHQSAHGHSQLLGGDFASEAAALLEVFSKGMCWSVLGYSCTDGREKNGYQNFTDNIHCVWTSNLSVSVRDCRGAGSLQIMAG